jgi:hypothetical protein
MRKHMTLFACVALAAAQVAPAHAQDAQWRGDEEGVQSRVFMRFSFGDAPEQRPLQFGLGVYGGEACAIDSAQFSPAGACETRLRGLELRGSSADDIGLWATGPREVNLLEFDQARANASGDGGGWVWLWVGVGVLATAAVVSWALDEDEAENCPDGYVADFLGECQPIVV